MKRALLICVFIISTVTIFGQEKDSLHKISNKIVLINSYDQHKKVVLKNNADYDLYYFKADSSNTDSIKLVEDIGLISDVDSVQVFCKPFWEKIPKSVSINKLQYIKRDAYERQYGGGGYIAMSLCTIALAPIISINVHGGPYHMNTFKGAAITSLVFGALGAALYFIENKTYLITERNKNKKDRKYWYIEKPRLHYDYN